jgi:GntR family mannosyl-D-glycerate transport/metabolism transcriptional repressor
MSKKNKTLYKQIERDIYNKIMIEHYLKDSLIPPEQELARQYGVSRVTIRKATDSLVQQGYLEKISGVGTYVRKTGNAKNPVSLMGFSQEMASQGIKVSTRVTVFRMEKATTNIADKLGINENDPIYYFERERCGNDRVFVKEQTYMSSNKYPDISLQVLEKSKYNFFEKDKGLIVESSHHVVEPLLANEDVAKDFNINVNTPILRIGNTTYFTNGEVMDYTILTLNSPNYKLSYVKYKKDLE